MSSKTKIIVLKSKELIYTGIFIVLGILLILLPIALLFAESSMNSLQSVSIVAAFPIGIVIADALLGEITPAMAAAVCQSGAKRVLVPINHCENYVVGVPDQPVSQLVAAAAQKVKELCSGKSC